MIDQGEEQCVGCDASIKGTYRPDVNWHLCKDCYEDYLDNKDEEK
jgi:hypothetical protein|tara:strand:- start:308 stop:442 length:135 start_codon:yes stop_codon:yes gene_type:complete